VTFSLQTNAPGRRRPFSDNDIMVLSIDEQSFAAPDSGRMSLAPGERCFAVVLERWTCSTLPGGIAPRCHSPTPLEWSYTVSIQSAPTSSAQRDGRRRPGTY
jgi:hypothetical protein